MRLLDLYKVETLDVRFQSPSSQPHPSARPSKWKTWEYYLYYAIFLTIPILMFKSVYDVSKPEHPGYQHYEHLLSEGWIPGRKLDDSDSQYSGFRENIPYMLLVLCLHPILRKIYESLAGGPERNAGNPNVKRVDPETRLQSRISFDLTFAIIFLLALHGFSTFKVLVILYLNFQIGTALPKQYAGIATWTFNIGILFANELCHGYQFRDIAALILPAATTAVDGPVEVGWGEWVDSYGGLLPRWEILFNITVLRLIAFNFDHLWMQDRRAGSPIEVCLSLSNVSTRETSLTIIPLEEKPQPLRVEEVFASMQSHGFQLERINSLGLDVHCWSSTNQVKGSLYPLKHQMTTMLAEQDELVEKGPSAAYAS
jgi:hypothetical protein